MKSTARISVKGLLLAPILVPAVFALLFSFGHPHALFGFAFFFAMAALVVYPAMALIYLPLSVIVQRFAGRGYCSSAALGASLGIVLFFLTGYFNWRSSGPDSGPPVKPLLAFLFADPLWIAVLLFALGGAATALLYQWLADRGNRLKPQNERRTQSVAE